MENNSKKKRLYVVSIFEWKTAHFFYLKSVTQTVRHCLFYVSWPGLKLKCNVVSLKQSSDLQVSEILNELCFICRLLKVGASGSESCFLFLLNVFGERAPSVKTPLERVTNLSVLFPEGGLNANTTLCPHADTLTFWLKSACYCPGSVNTELRNFSLNTRLIVAESSWRRHSRVWRGCRSYSPGRTCRGEKRERGDVRARESSDRWEVSESQRKETREKIHERETLLFITAEEQLRSEWNNHHD